MVDDFDLLGVNHFFNLFDAYYCDLCPSDPKTRTSSRTSKQAGASRLGENDQKLARPVIAPSDKDFSFEDSFVLLDCARRVLLRLNLDEDAGHIKALSEQYLLGRPLSSKPETEPLEDRLPPRESVVVDFVGREKELNLLWEWFKDPVSRKSGPCRGGW